MVSRSGRDAEQERRRAVLRVVLILGALERRSLAEYGLPLQKMFGKNFGAGALWGFAILTANIALMALTGAYSFGKIVLPIGQIVKYGRSGWRQTQWLLYRKSLLFAVICNSP
jgi:hypothetical protein